MRAAGCIRHAHAVGKGEAKKTALVTSRIKSSVEFQMNKFGTKRKGAKCKLTTTSRVDQELYSEDGQRGATALLSRASLVQLCGRARTWYWNKFRIGGTMR